MHSYAELHCQSAFSLLDGASLPETLVRRANELGYYALALTDFTDLGGAVRFSECAQSLSVRGIIGTQVSVKISSYQGRVVLLAENNAGYVNLSRLVTSARMNSKRGFPSVTLETLSAYSKGIYCLTGGPRGAFSQCLFREDQLGAERILKTLYSCFNDRLSIEVVHHGLPAEMDCAMHSIRLANQHQIPWVVTNDVRYARVEDRNVYDTLNCLKVGKVRSQCETALLPNAEWALKASQKMWRRWRENPAGLLESVRIAERCQFRLEMLEVPLPNPSLPRDFQHADTYLRHLVHQGMLDRWGRDTTRRHRQQLEHELGLIVRRGLAGYFLIMWEIIAYARQQKILVQGRGSAANSAVCYVLGITAVDPIAHQLLFERFLSDARQGYPDIDLDIEHARREEVIQFVYEKYGRDKAAMVCAHQCFRIKGAVRDTARILEFTQFEAERFTALAAQHGHLSVEMLTSDGWGITDKRLQTLVEIANRLVGLPRHRGTHSGGFVLSAHDIFDAVAIEPAAMQHRSIIQWDKDDLECMKVPKFDLLGLGILTVISRGLELVRDRYDVPAYLYRLPDIPEVYDMIRQADTVGVFQIESRAQMNSLPRTQPRNLYELAIQVALIRPGPLQGDMVHPYIRRRRGEEVMESIHPSIDSILGRTLGVPLFQEQGMRLAVEVAGFSPTQAERLRRAIGSARSRHEFPDLLAQLQDGFVRRGLALSETEKLIRNIAAFSTYGFPESHSISFALLVYASAWLKCVYPAEFLTALLNAQPMGFYSVDTLISDAQRHGVRVVSPCLKNSGWYSVLRGEEVWLGLRWIKGLGKDAKYRLENARRQAPFYSLDDVFSRCTLPKKAWLTLVEAGTFRHLISGGRRQVMWQVLRCFSNRQLSLALAYRPEPKVSFPTLSERAKSLHDYLSMGLSTGPHPMALYRNNLNESVHHSMQLRSLRHGQWVTVAGVVISRQRPTTAKGFCFISLEDEYGFVNVIVSPQRFEQNWRVLTRARSLLISGRLSIEQNVINLKAIQIQELRVSHTEGLPSSRDFR